VNTLSCSIFISFLLKKIRKLQRFKVGQYFLAHSV